MGEPESNYEFQAVIAKFIEKMGFEIASARILGDGSIDFKAQTTNPMGGRVVSLIRASTFSRMVNQSDVDNLRSSMDDVGAVRAAYVTTSGFSDEAVEAARDKPISLINKYQLMDSLEKRGLLKDTDLMEALDKFGMGERHFQGFEQSFGLGITDKETKAYFQKKGKKDENPASMTLRYSPVSVFKAVSYTDMSTEDQTLRTVEKKDYLFVNLNNLDLYYLTQKRARNATEYTLMRSDIIKKIYTLPGESQQHLLNLIDHGDLPVEDIQGEELSILRNKKVIDTYEGKRMKTGSLAEYAQMILEEALETLNLIVSEIVTGISAMGEETKGKVEEKPKKKVYAVINMPHVYGGIYDIWKYMDAEKGLRQGAEIDGLNYTSKEISALLKSIMKAKVSSEGIIFMPYYRTKYVDPKGKVTKYEVLVAPKFKKEVSAQNGEVVVKVVKPKKKSIAGDFKLIK